jgi:hypothetical protein
LLQENLVAPLGSSISGAVFTSRQPKLVTAEDLQRFPSDLTRRHYAEGIRSGCVLPLIRCANERRRIFFRWCATLRNSTRGA